MMTPDAKPYRWATGLMDFRKEMSESDVVKSCLHWLLYHGCFVWRNNTGRRGRVSYGLQGSADIIGITPSGKFIGIECKVGKNKPDQEQIAFGGEISTRKGIYMVAYSSHDLEQLRGQL